MFERRDWVGIPTPAARHYSYFDTERRKWIEDIDGTNDGHAEERVIEYASSWYQEHVELILPDDLAARISRGEVFSLTWTGAEDSLTMTFDSVAARAVGRFLKEQGIGRAP